MGRLQQYLQELRRPRTVIIAVLLLAVIGVAGYLTARNLWAGRHLRAAEQALSRNDFVKARAHLLLCLEVWPDNAQVHFLLARTARRGGAYAEAAERLADCEKHGGAPEMIAFERLLARAQRAEFSGVEPLLWKYLHAHHPDKPLICEALAHGYMQTFRLPLALDALAVWLEIEPDNVQALFWRGQALEHLRRYGEARANFQRAVELNPNHDEARLFLADGLRQVSQLEEALAHYLYLRQRRPGDPQVALGVASCHASLGRPAPARVILETLVKEFPQNAAAWVQLGKVELDDEKPAKAEPWLRKGYELNPYDRDGAYQLLQCLRQLGHKDEVGKLVARLEEIDHLRGRLADLSKQMIKSPRNASLRCQTGEVFLKMGNDKEGLRWMQSALQEDPTHQDTHRVLRDYFRSRGDEQLAAYHDKALGKRSAP